MKKNLMAMGIFSLAFIFNVSAKQIQVSVLNFSFSPSNFTANIGDTIHFVWSAGFHTTTSTSVPLGALTWDAPMDTNDKSFFYPVTTAGSYAFQCSFHAAMGMVGSFTVAAATPPNQSWNLTGNSDAATASKLGTTNAVPVALFTNNLERMRIDTSGRVGIGITNPVNIFTLKSSGGTPAASWLDGLNSPIFMGFADNVSSEFVTAAASNTTTRRPIFHGRRSRGTLVAPAIVANNDFLSSILASGFDGTTFQNPATIDFFVDSIPSAGNVPARISFVTGSNQANRKERLKVGSTGNFNFNNNQIFLRQSDGRVGIGTTSPGAKFHVAGNSLFTANLTVSSGGIAVSSDTGFAGDFRGSVHSTVGFFTSSDKNVKKNIREFNNAMGIINKLKPKYYEFKDDQKYAFLNLPGGSHYGLIAQDVEQVLPNLVKASAHEVANISPALISSPGKALSAAEVTEQKAAATATKESIKAVNYIELIPIMIKGMQEEQALIEQQQTQIQELSMKNNDLQSQVNELRSLISKGDNGNAASITSLTGYLKQNIPNPAGSNTVISYYLPDDAGRAQIRITDIKGSSLKVYNAPGGNGQVNIMRGELPAGVYNYTLYVNDKLVDSKQMVITK